MTLVRIKLSQQFNLLSNTQKVAIYRELKQNGLKIEKSSKEGFDYTVIDTENHIPIPIECRKEYNQKSKIQSIELYKIHNEDNDNNDHTTTLIQKATRILNSKIWATSPFGIAKGSNKAVAKSMCNKALTKPELQPQIEQTLNKYGLPTGSVEKIELEIAAYQLG